LILRQKKQSFLVLYKSKYCEAIKQNTGGSSAKKKAHFPALQE